LRDRAKQTPKLVLTLLPPWKLHLRARISVRVNQRQRQNPVEWTEFYGGYHNIPPNAWADWDRLSEAYHERQRYESGESSVQLSVQLPGQLAASAGIHRLGRAALPHLPGQKLHAELLLTVSCVGVAQPKTTARRSRHSRKRRPTYSRPGALCAGPPWHV